MPTPAIVPGSLVLVTGANGYIASNVILELLTLGYRVRGTVRSSDKGEATATAFKEHGPLYEYVVVPDMSAPNAFAAAVRGAAAVIHLATVKGFGTPSGNNPNDIVTPTVAGALEVLKACTAEPSVTRVVYTSSSTAAGFSTFNPKTAVHVTAKSFNEGAVAEAWKGPFDGSKQVPAKDNGDRDFVFDQQFQVYAASKVASERAIASFVEREKPGFVVNTILPGYDFGRVVVQPPTNSGIIVPFLYGHAVKAAADRAGAGEFMLKDLPIDYFVDVVDTARLHVAAAVLDGGLVGERILSFSVPFDWNDVLGSIRRVRQDVKMMGDMQGLRAKDPNTYDNELGRTLLRKWYGQDDYKGLDHAVEMNLIGM